VPVLTTREAIEHRKPNLESKIKQASEPCEAH
jgi:hypothetical protein